MRRPQDHSERKKVAIIGSGCAGLGAAWALRNTDHEVHLFEKSSRLGGHTNTQIWNRDGKLSTPVDTGFIVLNSFTYPNFIAFLKEVGVDTVPTEMSFGVSRDLGAFEWSGSAQGIFAQRRNIFRPRMWRMIFDIIRFNQFALDLLAEGDETVLSLSGLFRKLAKSGSDRRARKGELTIGQYLQEEGYSQAFEDDYLIPMTAAVWSTSPDKASLDFPAVTLVRFMWNHHLLSTIAARPDWMTIPGGSQKYIDAIVTGFPKDRLNIHTNTTVTGVSRSGSITDVHTSSEIHGAQSLLFDHVILACHGDEVLPILGEEASSEERGIFNAFQTTENIGYLHSDLSLMPTRRATWSAWNYLITSSHPSKVSHPAGVSLTYWMNCLQHINEDVFGPVLVTLNPPHKPDPELTQGQYVYRHPLYNAEAVQAQKRLEGIQNTRGVSYCGAWTNYGFHEDGFSSGLKASIDALGAKLPFEFVDSTYRRGHRPELGWKDYVLRIVLAAISVAIRIVETFIRLPIVSFVVWTAAGVASLMLDVIDPLLEPGARAKTA